MFIRAAANLYVKGIHVDITSQILAANGEYITTNNNLQAQLNRIKAVDASAAASRYRPEFGNELTLIWPQLVNKIELPAYLNSVSIIQWLSLYKVGLAFLGVDTQFGVNLDSATGFMFGNSIVKNKAILKYDCLAW